MATLKERLRNGEQVIGTMLTTFTQADTINMMQVCGIDFIIIDCEHGSIDYSTVQNLLGRARALDMPTLVRIPEARREVILKYMDAGAYGLLLPNCDTVEQAQALVSFAKYAPMGNRGVSLLRPHTGYRAVPSAVDYMKETNEETIMMIQVESPTSLENLDDILKVEGVDMALVGPNDLSQSLGIMGQYQNPTFLSAMDHVIATAKANNKFSGVHFTASPNDIVPYMEKGMSMNLWSNDIIMMMNYAKEGFRTLREAGAN